MTKQEEKIIEFAEALEKADRKSYWWQGMAEILIQEGYGNVRRYRAKLIELYLKGQTAELLKFIMEEV
jgi:hypothetical protein